MNERGTFKWIGQFSDLCEFIEQLEIQPASQPAKWTTPGGGSKLFENSDISIRWYANNGTLTVNGMKAEEVKAKLMSVIQDDKNTETISLDPMLSYSSHVGSSVDDPCINLTNSQNSNLHTESPSTNNDSNLSIAVQSTESPIANDCQVTENNELKLVSDLYIL